MRCTASFPGRASWICHNDLRSCVTQHNATSGIQRLQSQAVLREVQRELLFFLPRSVVDHVAAQPQVETRQRPHSFPADDRDRRSTANSIRTNKLTSTFTC